MHTSINTPILLNGLSKLEYRGYDSAGIAVRDGENLAQVVKAKGRLSNLIEKTDEGKALIGTCGIGHTRWATHGEPSQINAHPHVSGNCTRSGSGEVESEVVGVHNGIIENYTELKEKLLKHGYTFYSQTDTEVVIKLVDYYYKKYNLGPIDAIAKTMVRVRGSYALELMFKDYPGEIWVARKDSPMIIGVTDGETYVASDVPAILKYTRNVYYIGNLEFARLTPGEAHFFNLDGDEIQWFAAKYANAHDVFFVGRGIDYAISQEGSLKLKEISYIHSEAYAAGELKHGTISLIEPGTLVIGVLTQSDLYEKTISNMLECKSRGAYLMGLTTYGKYEIEDQVNFAVYVPKIDEHFVGSLAVVPLQLMGYYVSVAKGLDVDKPRNLAKSVTVE